MNPKAMRSETANLMFNTFKVKSIYFGVQAVFALFAAGKTSGIVLDIGDSVTHVVPVFEGYVLPHAVQRTDMGGRDLTLFLRRLLSEQDFMHRGTLQSNVGTFIVDKIKR